MITLAAHWTDRQWTLFGWVALGVGVLILLGVSLLSTGRIRGPGALVKRIEATTTGRVLLLLGWMWLGWHLFAR